jgi:DNA-binding NarL/FixJ family response regulator
MSGDVADCGRGGSACSRGGGVLLVCADSLTRLGLRSLVAEDGSLEVIGACDRDSVIERVASLPTLQLVMFDDRIDRALVERIRACRPAARLLVVAERPSEALGMLLLAIGVACVARDLAEADLLAVTRMAARGQLTFARADGEVVMSGEPAATLRLTAREIEILELLSRDRQPGEIARQLGIRVETVYKHAARLRRKLNVSRTRELAGMPVPLCTATA